jgi:hypothetical protein
VTIEGHPFGAVIEGTKLRDRTGVIRDQGEVPRNLDIPLDSRQLDLGGHARS